MLNALHLAGELSMKFVSILAIGASALALAGCQTAGQQEPRWFGFALMGNRSEAIPNLSGSSSSTAPSAREKRRSLPSVWRLSTTEVPLEPSTQASSRITVKAL